MTILLPEILEEGGKPLGTVVDFTHSLSIWPVMMGLACCAIEMMAIAASRFDIVCFGSEVFRASPRHASVILVPRRVSHKMATIMRNAYDEMADPKWITSMGAYASSDGIFNNCATVQGCDCMVPTGIHLPGHPPCLETLLGASPASRDYIKKDPLGKRQEEIVRKTEAAVLKAIPTSGLKGLMT